MARETTPDTAVARSADIEGAFTLGGPGSTRTRAFTCKGANAGGMLVVLTHFRWFGRTRTPTMAA